MRTDTQVGAAKQPGLDAFEVMLERIKNSVPVSSTDEVYFAGSLFPSPKRATRVPDT